MSTLRRRMTRTGGLTTARYSHTISPSWKFMPGPQNVGKKVYAGFFVTK